MWTRLLTSNRSLMLLLPFYLAAKWQIILFIGFLEMYSEMAGTHYMRGGVSDASRRQYSQPDRNPVSFIDLPFLQQPGKYPSFKEPGLIPHPVPLELFDPFGYSKNKSAEAKERGLISELNNGKW